MRIAEAEYVLSTQDAIPQIMFTLLWMHPGKMFSYKMKTELIYIYTIMNYFYTTTCSNNNPSYFQSHLNNVSHFYIASLYHAPGLDNIS